MSSMRRVSPGLREVLNALAAAPGEDVGTPEADQGPLSGLQAPEDLLCWIGVDGQVLALYKHYLDARARYLQVLLTHGKTDGFCETAADMADSAWCALEARLYELHLDAAAAARADLAARLAEDAARQAGLNAQRARAAGLIREEAHEAARRAKNTENERQRRDFFLFWYWCRFVVEGGAQGGALRLSRAFAGA